MWLPHAAKGTVSTAWITPPAGPAAQLRGHPADKMKAWRHAAERAAHAETDLSEWRKQYTTILDSHNLGTMRGFPLFAFTGTEKLRVS